jgi:prevent-host-death family protein
MKTVPISTLKARLSEFLDVVRKGHEVVITDRGRPVARLLPVEGDTAREELRERLVREGVLSPPRKARSRKLVPPSGKKSSGLVAALLDERTEGR